MAEILLWMAMTAATVLSCVVCHNNWSLGIFCTILTGLLQEPLRKAIPGQPPWIHVAFLFPATFCVWRMMTIDRAGTTSRALCGELNGLKLPLVLAGTAILTASFARFSSGITAVNLKLVLLGWLGPVMLTIGCLIGARWAVASKADAVDSAIKLLCLTLTVFLAGHLLELNPAVYETNPAIGPLPPHRPWYRTIGAEQFRMFSGFFRSPDTAGWFAALQVSCAILASLTRDRTRARSLVFWKLSWFWLGVGAFGGFCCLLSGRRKMQVLLMLCLALGGVLQWIAGKYAPARQFWLRGLMVVALAVGFVSLVPQAEMYLSYFRTSPELAPARLVRETVAPIIGYSSEVSVFGLGLGAMTPGCQHVGGALPIYSEGGLARVFIEGGWFALFFFSMAVVMAFSRCLQRTLTGIRKTDDAGWRAVGLAFLCGSLVSFLIGHQVFGDPLVLFVTGLIAGTVYQSPSVDCAT